MHLKKKAKRKFIAEIVSKINQNNFMKSDFDKLSREKNIPIEKVSLLSQNDNKILKEELVSKIYTITEKKIIVMHDIDMSENFLIYIDKIENVTIDGKSDSYKKHLRLSRLKLSNELFNTYDTYIRKKYKIDINYKTLDTVKNYFN
jgi:Fe2+ transport system protein B